MDDAGAGDADVYDRVRLAHAVEGAGHEGVVLHRVAEDDELGAAEAALRGGELRGLLYDAAHERDGVHVYAGLRRADVDGGADQLRLGQGAGYGADKPLVRGRHALLHEGGEAADEVDARLAPGLVQRLGEAEIVLAVARARDEGNRRDGDALVDNRDAELGLYLLARAHKPLGPAGYLVVNLAAGGLRVAVAAVQKRNAHRDRAHVQMLLVYHLNGLEYFTAVYHAFDLQLPRTLPAALIFVIHRGGALPRPDTLSCAVAAQTPRRARRGGYRGIYAAYLGRTKSSWKLNLVHCVKYILSLYPYLYPVLLALAGELARELGEGYGAA